MTQCNTVVTVETLHNGHHWEPTFCPLRGVPNSDFQ